MKLAYFINQYPKLSHTFIRREILAIENLGHTVERFALRADDTVLVDPIDHVEFEKTSYVLSENSARIILICGGVLLRHPSKFFSVLWLASKMGLRSDRGLLRHIAYLLESCVLYNWQRQKNIQHIHAHFGTNSATVVMFARLLGGAEYSFTVHGPEEFDKPKMIHLSEKVKYSKFVVAVSSYGRSQLFRWVPHQYWNKIKEVHCGLETAFYEAPAIPVSNTNKLICVGRLCEQKGQMLLVEAASRLMNKGVSFQLMLAGDGELRAEIEKFIIQYGLQDRVKITGWINSDQVRKEILASRALVLPSFAEGLPVVLMEAMALRRPVLSTYVAGIPELITPGKNGWLIPAGSTEYLMEAIEDCLNTPVVTLREMGEEGFKRVVARHSVDIEAAKLTRLFDSSK